MIANGGEVRKGNYVLCFRVWAEFEVPWWRGVSGHSVPVAELKPEEAAKAGGDLFQSCDCR